MTHHRTLMGDTGRPSPLIISLQSKIIKHNSEQSPLVRVSRNTEQKN